MIVDNWQIGDRFNNNLKNPMWNINAFANPAAYTAGSVGRNTIEGPGLNWSQGSLAKTITVKERYNLDIRFDINNIFKQPNFNNPSSTVNLASPGTFGKPTGTKAAGAASAALCRYVRRQALVLSTSRAALGLRPTAHKASCPHRGFRCGHGLGIAH